MRIAPRPDTYSYPAQRAPIRYLGSDWMQGLAHELRTAGIRSEKSLTLDLSEVGFVTLFDWTCTIACLQGVLNGADALTELLIDAKGDNSLRIVPEHEYVMHKRGRAILYSPDEVRQSDRIYAVLGFIESLGGHSVLRHPASIGYRWMERGSAALEAFYSASGGEAEVHDGSFSD